MANKSIMTTAFPKEKGFGWIDIFGIKYLTYKGLIVSIKRFGSRREFFSLSIVISRIELPYPMYWSNNFHYFCCEPKKEFDFEVIDEKSALDLQNDAIAWLETYVDLWKDYLKENLDYRPSWMVERDLKDAPYAHTETDVSCFYYKMVENFKKKYPNINVLGTVYGGDRPFMEAILDKHDGSIIEGRKVMEYRKLSDYALIFSMPSLPSTIIGLGKLVQTRDKLLALIDEMEQRMEDWEKLAEAETYWQDQYKTFTEYALELKH